MRHCYTLTTRWHLHCGDAYQNWVETFHTFEDAFRALEGYSGIRVADDETDVADTPVYADRSAIFTEEVVRKHLDSLVTKGIFEPTYTFDCGDYSVTLTRV